MKRWIVYRLCDLHTWLSLAGFRVEDWLRSLDPTTPVPPKGYRAYGKMYWYDGQHVHTKELNLRVIEGSEIRFRKQQAQP